MAKFEATKSSNLRNIVLTHPSLSAEDIIEAWGEIGQGYNVPTKNDVYQARTQVKQKYGINDLNEVPFNRTGKINVSGLIRLLLKKNPDLTSKRCQELLNSDGIEYNSGLWTLVKNEGVSPKVEVEESPDPNQGKGPRARRVGKKRKDSAKKTVTDEGLSSGLLSMEQTLDAMIRDAEQANSKALDDLRAARRFISRSILASNE